MMGAFPLSPGHLLNEELRKSCFYYTLQLDLVQVSPGKTSTYSLAFL